MTNQNYFDSDKYEKKKPFMSIMTFYVTIMIQATKAFFVCF